MKRLSVRILFGSCLVVLMLFAVFFFGELQVYAIVSGSMEPEIETGSLIWVRRVPFEDIDAGDVITYRLNRDAIATHRVMEIHEKGQYFLTKGDANKEPDGIPVPYENVFGKVYGHIPMLGYAVSVLGQSGGAFILTGGITFLVLFDIFRTVLSGRETNGREDLPQEEGSEASGRRRTDVKGGV